MNSPRYDANQPGITEVPVLVLPAEGSGVGKQVSSSSGAERKEYHPVEILRQSILLEAKSLW